MVQDDRLIFLVFSAQQKLKVYLNAALSAAGVRVTIAQAGILFLLKQRDGRSMTELSQILGIDNSTMTGLTDRLERAGFVRRHASPSDRRASHIHITPEGLQEAESAKRVIRQVNEEIKMGFSGEDVASFKRVLNSFFSKFNRVGNSKGQPPDPVALTVSGNNPRGRGAGRETG